MVPFYFLKCQACNEPSHLNSLPLCKLCANSMLTAPRLCPLCAATACPPMSQCLRPWYDTHATTGIRSYSARYLMVAPCYTVLKSWKKKGCLFFSRRVLNWDGFEFPKAWEFARAIIPVPQSFSRSWRLGRSPALEIANSLSSRLKKPVIHPFETHFGDGSRQAEKGYRERLQTAISHEFSVSYSKQRDLINARSAILVDDFMTSGQTLRQTAQVLHQSGLKSVHVFVLGVRPLRDFEIHSQDL